MSTITASDVAANLEIDTHTALSEDDAADAFLTSFKIPPDDEEEDAPRKKAPSEEVETTTTEDDAVEVDEDEAEDSEETPEEEAEDEDAETTEQEADEDQGKKKSYVDSDDTFVKVPVGDEVHEVPVKDLKRLYGQEASLTKKSQEVAAQRKTYDDGVAKNLAALNVMLDKAKKKAEPYASIDWLAAAKNPNITAEDLTALQNEAKAAFEDVQFFEKDLGSLMTAVTDKQKADNAAQAKVCITALSTPGTAEKPNPLHIEGWNDKVYDDLRSFARELGAEAKAVDAMVDPVAFKVLHMALQFKRGSSKVLTVKTKKSPTKIVKTTSSGTATKTSSKAPTRAKAIEKLSHTGSEEDATNAFLASFTDRD